MIRHLMLAGALLIGPISGAALAAVESEGSGQTMPDMTGGSVPPKQMTIPAVPQGKNLKPAANHPLLQKPVTNPGGQKIGTIEKLLTSQDGKIEYAEVALVESQKLIPIPWNAFQKNEDGLVLNATPEQLEQGGGTFETQRSADFEHKGGEPLKPNLRQGGG